MNKILIGAIILITILSFGYVWSVQPTLTDELYPLRATILFPSGGGTGISTNPSYGQLLVGNAGGTYTLTATTSLGITSTATVNLLDDIGNVAMVAEAYGDLLMFDGSNWVDTATSTLGITADTSLFLTSSDYYATTTHANISSLPSLSITKSQVSDFGTYEAPLTFNYPITRNVNAVSLAFGTTTSNIWASTQTFGAVSGISLDEIDNLATDKIFTMGANDLTFNFTTPSNGLTVNALGAFSDHLLHLHQDTGNPGVGTEMLHIVAEDSDVLGLVIDQAFASSSVALKVLSGTTDLSGGKTTMSNASTTQLSIDATTGRLYIPANTNPAISATGDLGINTTTASSSIRFYDGTVERACYPEQENAFSFASSTLSYMGAYGTTGTTTISLANYLRPTTLYKFYCKTDKGTAWVGFGDGTATTSQANCSTSGVEMTPTTNNTWTIRENFVIEIGRQSNNPSNISITATLRKDAD